MEDQTQFIVEGIAILPDTVEDAAKTSGVQELEQQEIPASIFKRIETYNKAFSDTFGLPTLQAAKLPVDENNLPGCSNPGDELSCDSNSLAVCEPFDSQPTCSQGFPVCQQGFPVCSDELPNAITAVSLTPVDNSMELIDGLDEFSSEELDLVQNCLTKIEPAN